jgi:hypothetical protein
MANIFTDAVKFLGTTLKQIATPDTLKDWDHASRLFVGSNYRLMPKTGFMFHVFIDLNDSPKLNNLSPERSPKQELGMLVKSAELPKYTVQLKTHNAYNRPNIVQNKITYDPITIVFHDDSANVVRNFWYDYYRHYYRDTDYGHNSDTGSKDAPNRLAYRFAYKYDAKTVADFGYMPRREGSSGLQNPYLRSIRIYSLHQKSFSEYILINPVIRQFRHGQHDYSNTTSTLEHSMTIEYEHVIYNSGSVGKEVDGFATLHYDTRVSPLKQVGGVKSIFGTGGLLSTAGSVLGDIERGDFLAAAFKTARGINTARSMNLKKSLVSELTGIYTQSASQAVIGQISQAVNGSGSGRYTVPTVAGIDGATKYTGISQVGSVAQLAGAAILLNSTQISGRYRANPTVQSTVTRAPSNYSTALPRIPGTSAQATAPTNNTSIDQQATDAVIPQPQSLLNNNLSRDVGTRQIASIDRTIATLNQDLGYAGEQQSQANGQLSSLNSRLTAARALPVSTERDRLITELEARVTQTTVLRDAATASITQKQSQISSLQSEQAAIKTKLSTLGGS